MQLYSGMNVYYTQNQSDIQFHGTLGYTDSIQTWNTCLAYGYISSILQNVYAITARVF